MSDVLDWLKRRDAYVAARRTERELAYWRNTRQMIAVYPADYWRLLLPGEEPQPVMAILAREAYAATCVQIAILELPQLKRAAA